MKSINKPHSHKSSYKHRVHSLQVLGVPGLQGSRCEDDRLPRGAPGSDPDACSLQTCLDYTL